MEIDVQSDLQMIQPHELEEALEDPFSVRFLPDGPHKGPASRQYALGRTVADRYLFLSFATDCKPVRIVASRDMSEAERRFYDRRYAELR